MNAGPSSADPFRRVMAPVLDTLTADQIEAILHPPPDPELEAHLDQLSGKANEGRLTSEERRELEAYIRAGSLLGVLRGLLIRETLSAAA